MHTRPNKGFTLIELLVTALLLSILAAFLLPALTGSGKASERVRCAQTMRQLSSALLSAASENGMALPRSSHSAFAFNEPGWSRAILPYLGEKLPATSGEWAAIQARLFRCPSDRKRLKGQSYGLNVFFELRPDFDEYEGAPDTWRVLSSIPRPSKTILLAEVGGSSDHVMAHFWGSGGAGGYDCAHERHSGKANYAFVDGHVETLTLREVFDPDNGVNRWNPALAQ